MYANKRFPGCHYSICKVHLLDISTLAEMPRLPGMKSSRPSVSKEGCRVGGTLEAISDSVRHRINAARVTCVLLMMYVHVPNGQNSASGLKHVASTRIDHWLESVLIEGPGRASAALLSVVSGYLIVRTLSGANLSLVTLYKRRFVSIVIPMFFWALLTCVVYLILNQSHSLGATHSWHDKLNLVLFINEAPYGPTLHLGFLRDLFACVLLSPLLMLALKRAPVAAMSVLGVVYLFGHSSQLYIILRPLVIFGFAAGMLLALHRVRIDMLDKYWALFLLLTSVATVLIIWANSGLLIPVESSFAAWGMSLTETVLYPLCRVFGSLTIWCILPMLKSEKFMRLISRLSPYIFVAFCSHFLVLSVFFHGFWMPLVGDRDSYAFLIWFVSAPVMAMGASVAMVSAAARIYPPLVTLISGGRIRSSRLNAVAGREFLQAT
ncbi:MAG: acyltransferase [Granulosicoccus sp.]